MGCAIVRRKRFSRRGALVSALALACALNFAGPARAQKAAAAHDPAKLYIDADKMVYDKTRDIVTVDGAAVLYYKNRVLQADHVVYDRKAKRVRANGHVKLTDERGDVTYSPSLELTDD